MRNKKILYTLAAVLSLSTAIAGMAIADYDYEKLYGYEKTTTPLQAPQPVYNVQEEAQPVNLTPATVANPLPVVEQEVVQQPQPRFVRADGRPFVYTGVPCPTCKKKVEKPKKEKGFVYTGIPCPTCKKKAPEPENTFVYTGIPCQQCQEQNIVVPGTCSKCEEHRQEVVQERVQLISYVPENRDIHEFVQKDCCNMAPLALDHVDFRIKSADGMFSNRLGKYRFRIFGCRRYDKEAKLNSRNIMEKNINFSAAFEEALADCYKVLPMPKDLCLQASDIELPEYIVTAEITDYYMNVCDEYDWDKAEKKDLRSGSSEITVTWRLMDLTKSTVFWKGESVGYGELYAGEKDGEIKLIERAFADAVSNLRSARGFDEQLLQRVGPLDMLKQRTALIEEERALDPVKCGYVKEYQCAKGCQISRPGFENCCCDCHPCEAPVVNCVDESGELIVDGACHVVDDTWVDTGDVKSLDTLCIVATDPCKALTPETMYRLRASVVEIDSPNNRKGAGLLISDRFILTSGDLVDNNNNNYVVKTVRNNVLSAHAVRINPSKNTALLMLDESVPYTPLALNLSLPEVGRSNFLTLGVLDVKDFKDGENYLENSAKIEGYRYTPEKGAEILANTFIQNVTVGGALFYKDCTVSGMAHSGIKTDDGLDVYVPTETALRSLGISICGHEYVEESPWQQTVYKPVTEQITVIQTAPEPMKPQDRK